MTSRAKSTSDADSFVGLRIREKRTQLGLSQQQLAEQIGITYQQQHKYERAINRIPAGRLYQIATALGVGVDFFFEGYEAGAPVRATGRTRLQLELARSFARIPNEAHQMALTELARALAGDARTERH